MTIHNVSTHPSRRNIFSAGAAIAALAATGASAAPTPKPDLHTLVQEYIDHMRAERMAMEAMTPMERGTASALSIQASWRGEVSAEDVMVERIAECPARSASELRAKAKALHWFYGGSDDFKPLGIARADALLSSLLADIVGRA